MVMCSKKKEARNKSIFEFRKNAVNLKSFFYRQKCFEDMINLHVHPLLYLYLPNSALAHLFLCVWLCMSLCDLKKKSKYI